MNTCRRNAFYFIGLYKARFVERKNCSLKQFDRNHVQRRNNFKSVGIFSSGHFFVKGTLSYFTMKKQTKKLQASTAFDSFLRILKVYNSENFRRNDRRENVRNFCFALGVFVSSLLIVNMITFGIWYLFDNNGDFTKFIVSGPIVLSIVQILIAYITLTWKNREVDETVKQLQDIVDLRKLGVLKHLVT